MSFLRKIFGLSSNKTPLNDVDRICTSKLPIPEVGGEYYIRFYAKKLAGRWCLDYETNCEFMTKGKEKSLKAFEKAKETHLEDNKKSTSYLETAVLLLADLENAHLQYCAGNSPIEQDKKTKKYHYIYVLDKMPTEMQNEISCRWSEYQQDCEDGGILPKDDTKASAPRRALPGSKRDSSGYRRRH